MLLLLEQEGSGWQGRVDEEGQLTFGTPLLRFSMMVDTCCESSKTFALWSVCLKVQAGQSRCRAFQEIERKKLPGPPPLPQPAAHMPQVSHTEHSDGSHTSMPILPGSATRGWLVAV